MGSKTKSKFLSIRSIVTASMIVSKSNENTIHIGSHKYFQTNQIREEMIAR